MTPKVQTACHNSNYVAVQQDTKESGVLFGNNCPGKSVEQMRPTLVILTLYTFLFADFLAYPVLLQISCLPHGFFSISSLILFIEGQYSRICMIPRALTSISTLLCLPHLTVTPIPPNALLWSGRIAKPHFQATSESHGA